MMSELFVLALGVSCGLMLRWGFRVLPQERWQIIASIPLFKEDPERWKGVNLTYYGLFTANGVVAAVIIYLTLMGAIKIPLQGSLVVTAAILPIGILGSKAVARIVERKMTTSTVVGASLLPLLAFPGLIWLANKALGLRWGLQIPILPSLAAAATAFALGGGIGRLACISFGCCYGKRLSQLPPILQKLFGRWSPAFFGKTKKIAYEGGLEKEKVVPTQAITSLIFVLAGLLGTLLFLKSFYTLSFSLSMGITQGWRALSEFLRADYRGPGKITAYQGMAFFMILYSLAIASLLPVSPTPNPNLVAGIQVLWNPAVILSLEAIWFIVFFYYGRSAVTAAQISFYVVRDSV